MKLSWTTDITRLLWRQATRNKEYGLTEATTGISVESTPSSIFLDSGGSNNFSGSHNYTRSRNMDMSSASSARANENPPSNKRLSWMSAGESSGSSGVFDLGSLPEDGPLVYSPRDDLRTFFKRGDGEVKYSSLPRRKISHQLSTPVSKADIVMDNAVTLRRDIPGAYDVAFIRNNVYRKTLQVETPKLERAKTSNVKHIIRRYSNGGRYATQPIIMPSSLSFTEGLANAGKYKKVSSECGNAPNNYIKEILEEDTSTISKEINIQDDTNLLPQTDVETSLKNTSTISKEINIQDDTNLLPQTNVEKSLENNKIDNTRRRHSSTGLTCTSLPISRSFPESSTEKEHLPKARKYSFSRSLTVIDCNSIIVDERQKGKEERQRSGSSDTSSSCTTPKLSPKSQVSNIIVCTSSKSAAIPHSQTVWRKLAVGNVSSDFDRILFC